MTAKQPNAKKGRPAGEPTSTIPLRVPVAAREQWTALAASKEQSLTAWIVEACKRAAKRQS